MVKTVDEGVRRHWTRQRVWLLAGALGLGGSVALAVGSGTAHADAGPGASASDDARTAAAAGASGRNPGQRVTTARSAATANAAAVTPSPAQAQTAGRARTAVSGSASSGRAPGGNTATCLQTQTCGTVTFDYTGGTQIWQVPDRVMSVFVTAQGGYGGYAPATPYTDAAIVNATVQLNSGDSPPITALSVAVGGAGGVTVSNDAGGGGFNGGGPGGAGSLTGTGGSGGGGATSITVGGGGPPGANAVVVAGGSGGAGGQRDGSPGSGGLAGGAEYEYPTAPPPGSGGVWPGNAGTAATGANPGAGGAGGTQSDGIGAGGGTAEDLSGNAGGGGGGGGFLGGAGGQPGLASLDPFATAGSGGGGGGGSSYADPVLTYNASAASAGAPSVLDGNAQIQWVDILTTNLVALRAGTAARQELIAVPGEDLGAVTWQVSEGALPQGLTLGSSGQLSGTPTKAGSYSFQATVDASDGVSMAPLATSVITYTGTVCPQQRAGKRCTRGDRR